MSKRLFVVLWGAPLAKYIKEGQEKAGGQEGRAIGESN